MNDQTISPFSPSLDSLNGTDGQDAAERKEPTWEDHVEALAASQRHDRNVELDRQLKQFLLSPQARDEQRAFAFYDDYTANRFGVRGDHGNCWTPDRQPFATARQYADALVGILNRGYSAIATDEYKAWMDAKTKGDRAAMIACAKVSQQKTAHDPNGNGGLNAYFDPGMGAPNAIVDKTADEIDDELKEYGARIEAQNFIGTMNAVGYDFTDAERDIVHAALKNGDGLPEARAGEFALMCRQNPEKAARALYLINASRRNQPAFWRDLASETAAVWNKTYGGLRTAIEDALTEDLLGKQFAKAVKDSPDSAKYFWNDAEKAEFKRLTDLYASTNDSRAGWGPQMAVDAMCARRLAREALPKDVRNRQRKEALMLEDALSHHPYTDYGFGEKAVIGAVSTLPYMTLTAIPYAGFAANTVSYFEQTRDDILMAGGNPDEAVGTQLVLAAAWSGIEKLEFGGLMGKPLTGLQKKAAIARIWKATGKEKLTAIGQLAKATEKEALAKTLFESVQEGIQGGLEGGEKAYFKTHDLGDAFAAAGRQAMSDFADSIGSMGILGHLGAVRATMTANRDAINVESLTDFTSKRLQAMNILKGQTVKTADVSTAAEGATEAERPAKPVNELMRRATTIWEKAPNAVAALDEIKETFGLTDEQTDQMGDYLDLRQNLLEVARTQSTDEAAQAVAAIAGNAFRIGADTTYDPVDLMQAINPDITVEDVDVTPPSPEIESMRRRVNSLRENAGNAKNASERKRAERKVREAEKALAKAERKLNPIATRRVTVPLADGKTATYTITENREGANIHDRGFAVSVQQAMEPAVADGEAAPHAATPEEFKALPLAEKLKVAVTADQYMAMTDDEREDYVKEWGLAAGGNFRITDENEKELFGTEGLVEMMRAYGKPGTRAGGNWTLAHEHGHAISQFARNAGLIKTDSRSVAVMRKLFGDPRNGVDELWNEESANDGLADYLRGKFDFKRLTPEERKTAKGFFKNLWDVTKGILTMRGITPPDTPQERSLREQAFDAAYEALRKGDFSGLDAFAGMDIGDATPAPATPPTPTTTPTPATPTPATPTPATPPPTPTPTPADNDRFQAGWDAAMAALAADPEAAKDRLPLRTGTKRTVFTPGYEMNIEAEAMWVPLDDLVESTDDREVQMRDRSRRATDQQVLEKTRKGVFQPLALFPGTKSDDGSPIVGGGLRIISGHGRKRMLQQLAKEGRYAEYLDAVNAEAAQQGMPTAPEGMKNPVLVLRATKGLEKREDLTRFAELSNRWGGLERSGAEHAESDARKITDALLRLYAPDASGNLLAASNRPFMAAFLKEVGATGLTNADGTPTPEAALRVQRALMTAIFGSDDKVRSMVRDLLEKTGDLSLGTLQNALMRSAGRLLAMKRQRGSFDIVADVREAAYQYIAWRAAQQKSPRLTLLDHLNQNDFFTESASPMQQALARLLDAGRFGTVLDKYAELVAQQSVDEQATFGFFARKTAMQMLGEAERAILPEGETAVTPDPTSAEAAEPVQTEPETEKPVPTPTDPVEAAQDTIAPPEPETFAPVPVKRGTATLPGPGAEGIQAFEIYADGTPRTTPKKIPAGAYNLLRGPYDVRKPPKASAQDKAGRGLGIANPPPANDANGKYWGNIFPHFQGNKTAMADRTSQAIRRNMSRAEREHYTTVVDYFGGGGCWGLYHALTNFTNARQLVVNEYEPGRLLKIRLLHEYGEAVADMTMDAIDRSGILDAWREACRVGENGEESGSGTIIKNKLAKFFDRFSGDELGLIMAVYDVANTMRNNIEDELTGKGSFDAGLKKIIDTMREDGRKAKEAADAFKARGGSIAYRQGDAAGFHDAPSGHQVVAVCDPPYYLTENYTADGKNAGIVPLEGEGWSYNATRRLLQNLVDKGDALVYTDEAWWHKETYSPDRQADFFNGGKSPFEREQEILLDIINTLDHFDVAGRVDGRQEVLGIHHGHDKRAENGENADTDGSDVRSAGADQAGAADDNRSSVRRVARGSAAQDRASVLRREGRGRAGERAIAREVIAANIAAAVAEASPDSDPQLVDRLVRHSVRQVREDKMAEYAKTVSKNAKAWLKRRTAELDKRMKAAGYTEKVWHGHEGEDFNVFQFNANNHSVPAAYFTYNMGTAQNYAALRSLDVENLDEAKPNVRGYYINPGKMLILNEKEAGTNYQEFVDTIKKAYENGYDSVKVLNAFDDQGFRFNGDETIENMAYPDEVHDVRTDILIVMQHDGETAASRIKASDPVTFLDEDYGELPIPLEMRAAKDFPDLRFSVYGAKGAARAGIGTADKAEEMERDGATREDIWRETGWWRGHDGKWRIDVDDEAFAEEIADALSYEWADENDPDRKPSVADIIAAADLKTESLERLVKAYPEIAKTKLSIEPDPFSLSGNGPRADYNAEKNEIRVFNKAAFKGDDYDARSVAFEIVHEIQHAIQTAEGHPNGKKVSSGGFVFLDGARERRKNIRDTIANYGEMEAYIAQRRHIAGPYERMAVPPWEMERMYLQSANRQYGFRLGTKDIRWSVRNAMQDLADGKEFGELHNQKYGTIKYPIGKSGKKGYGFLHIVEQRMTKDGATLDEALNTAIKVGEAAEIGKETEQRHNTHHLDLDGTRAIIGEMPDKTIVITGYEINTEESTVAKQRAAELSPRPHVRSEEVFRALKEKLASTPHSIPYSADGSQQPSVAPATERELSPENARIRNSIIAGVRGKARKDPSRATRLSDAIDKYNAAINDGRKYDDELRREIYIDTGWWMGVDGKWRFELPNIKPKTRVGKTDSIGKMIQGVYIGKFRGEPIGICLLDMIARAPELFDAYPMLKKIPVYLRDPDDDDMDGVNAYYDGHAIHMIWDFVKWINDEQTNILNEDGVKTLTHEIQHVVQNIERFPHGGSQEVNGPKNYWRLAGEVEARNAARRNTNFKMYGGFARLASPDADENLRTWAVKNGNAPWQTEDVPEAKQILTYGDGEMTDVNGNPVARQSVRRTRTTRLSDTAAALVAARHLAGKEVDPEDVDKLLKNLGLKGVNAAAFTENAKALAERNRATAKKLVARQAPELMRHLEQANLSADMDAALDAAITGGATAANPDLGAKVQKAIESKQTRDLMNAHGFTAAQMMAELPVDLAKGLFAVAEYEKTPEELARLEKARKDREEERRRAEEEDDRTEDEKLVDLDDPAYREPTADEQAKIDALMDRARFMDEARRAEEERKKAEKKKRKDADDEGSAPEATASGSEGDPEVLPLDTVRRIAPVFESADLFAQFLVEWTADHVCEKHPNIPTTAEMWKNPVAIRELKQTATHILRKLAKDALGSPSLNAARNYADHAINELESDAEIKTYAAVRRKIARIYDRIHDNALRISRRKQVNELVKQIRKLAGAKGRFSAIQEELTRTIDAKTELWARRLIPCLTMTEQKALDEQNRLTALVTLDPTDETKTPPTEDQLEEYADRLALLKKYGALVHRMPGEIADAAEEILAQLNGQRQAFEAKREQRKAENEAARKALVEAMEAGNASGYRKPGETADRIDRFMGAMMGNLTLEMQNLVRYCKDEAKRSAALNVIQDIAARLSEGTATYRLTLGQAQSEIRAGLTACYGSAEAGMRHLLKDEIDEATAQAVFTQDRNRVPTYGRLLQLYATTIQADYKTNADAHGRTAQLEAMERALTDKDKAFLAWAVEWYKHNRKALSDSVEAMTGLPVTSPDAMYTPARMLTEPSGFGVEASAWSPVPSALNRRVRHGLDFNESVNFLSMLQEQAEVRAQTIGYGEVGIYLRDILAHHDVQASARKNVGKRDIQSVLTHVKDVLVQNAERKDAQAFFAPINVARSWMARFALSGNIPSAIKQLASMPVWANAILNGQEVGLKRCLGYLTTVATDEGREAIRDLMASDGFKARYTMGWSEETQNVLQNPSKNRVLRYIEKAFDKGMIVNKAVDGLSCLWMAQGFYRDARDSFLDQGMDPEEAKRKAIAITWSVCENGQQSGRIENMNVLQRRGGALAAAIFQYKTAYLLQNNYVFQAIREMRAGTPGAKGRFLRALFINNVWIPAFVMAVNAAWSALMGDEPPEDDPEKMPGWFKDFAWSMIDGTTAPIFGLSTAAHMAYNAITGTKDQYGQTSDIPALASAYRVIRNGATVIVDLGKGVLQEFDAFDFEEELTGEKLGKDVDRLLRDLAAPYRHASRAIRNRSEEN